MVNLPLKCLQIGHFTFKMCVKTAFLRSLKCFGIERSPYSASKSVVGTECSVLAYRGQNQTNITIVTC